MTKDMGRPRYFLKIEIAYSKHGVVFSQQKYTLDLLQETGLLGCKTVHTPIGTDIDLWHEIGSLFEDISQYRRLVCKLIFLTVRRPDIAYVVGLASQLMHKPERFIGRVP